MRPAFSLTAVGTSLAIAVAPAAGAGFGPSTQLAQLGRPLDFSAVVHLAPDESLARECVAAEVQAGDDLLPGSQVRIALESPAGSSDRRIRVTTLVPIEEPIATVTLTLRCGVAPLSRRFLAFVDPPALPLAPTPPSEAPAPVASNPASAPPIRSERASAPLPVNASPVAIDAMPRSTPGRRGEPARRSVAATPPLPRPAALRPLATAASVRPAASGAAPNPARTAAPHAASGPRLRLEPDAALVAARAAAPAPAASGAPASVATSPFDAAATAAAPPGIASMDALPPIAAAPAAAPVGLPASAAAIGTVPAAGASAVPLVGDRERIRLLEESLAGLRNDARADRVALAALQARLQRAEAERYGSPLVYALALASALLALALALAWRRQPWTRRGGHWWVGRDPGPVPSMYREHESMQPAAGPAPGVDPTRAASADGLTLPSHEPTDAPDSIPDSTRPAPFVASAAAPLAGAPAAAATPAPGALSVEELIDLEQQVDFFTVLGQDDAAIDLLTSHVQSDGGISPLPYLKLLEVHRRRGDEAAYRELRERFNRRFNAYAPGWGSHLAEGRSLVDYPDTLARLQALWPTPPRAMETLDASLVRRNPDEDTFDLPAYRELLLLYSVARDLAGRAAAPPVVTVDLALPFDDPRDAPISRLTATASDGFGASEMATLPLDLDVSVKAARPSSVEVETVPSALRRSGHRPFSTDSNFAGFDRSGLAGPPKSTN